MLPPIVDDAWLASGTNVAQLVIVHVGTPTSGSDPHDTYLHARLPGARFVSLDDDLAGPPAAIVGRHPLPSVEAFAQLLHRLGIDEHTDVVAYDDVAGGASGAYASRFVWMLRLLGRSAALLDRGDTPIPPADPADVPAQAATPVDSAAPGLELAWPVDGLADADDVAGHIADGGVVIDSRSPDRYAGIVEPIDAIAGHIPGAINLAFTDNIGGDGRIRPLDELASRFSSISSDPAPIVSCGSGITACHNALAIEASGLPLPRVYVGSWSGWSTDPARAIATGSEPIDRRST